MEQRPIFVNDLLYKLDKKLIELLRGLSVADWSKQTIAPKWKVKDVAVHLLDGNIRALSMLRDKHFTEVTDPLDSYKALVTYLNRLNADWIKAMQRVSPKVLVELLELTGKEFCEFMKTLNPFDKAVFSVAWAGEEESKNWFHVAREYTEKWHHQQQIRLAIGDSAELLKNEFYVPYLETSMRALPHHYRTIKGKEGDSIKIVVLNNGENAWLLKRNADKWELQQESLGNPSCEVRIPGEIAWRIFTKGISKKEALEQSEIVGKQQLGGRIFELVAVMA
ncbi:MAG: maleylpyruvate isomerase N-terminal domain-containing protein [Bacteroidota bacterium]